MPLLSYVYNLYTTVHPLGSRRCQHGKKGSVNYLERQFLKFIVKQLTCAQRGILMTRPNTYKESWLNAHIRRHDILRSSALAVFLEQKQPPDRRPIQTRLSSQPQKSLLTRYHVRGPELTHHSKAATTSSSTGFA